MELRISSLYLALLLPWATFAQTPISGTVRTVDAGSTQPVPGANVLWAGSTIGTTTDAQGRFSLAVPPSWPAKLVASFVGYTSDTLLLTAAPQGPLFFTLKASVELKAFEVVERQSSTKLDTRSLQASEIITSMELKRAACCDISESFETNATVDVSFNDAISGTKTIRMLGLDGKYAQMSVENIPFIRGLSTSSGLNLIPGTWVNEINLSKGVGTAVNGPNAMTGQIDLCLVQPATEPPLFVNLYGNSQGRLEANIHSAQKTGKYSDNLLLLHGNWFDLEMDQNNDGFLDQPLSKRVNIMDRWMYHDENRTGQVAVRYVNDQRTGGQASTYSLPATADQDGRRYGIKVQNEMVDVFGKYGTIFKSDPTKSIGFSFAGRRHDVDSRYGDRTYTGVQESLYGNAVYQQLLGDGNDQIKAGLSFQYDDYKEAFRDSSFNRTELMPGAFAEYTSKHEKFTWVGGMRVDVNDLYGTALSPRAHLKYDLGPLTVGRISAGHAFRTANPLVESSSVLASSRTVVVDGDLGMERAWNFGAAILHKFKFLDRKWALGIDAYHTRFTDQVVSDLERAPQTVAFYMLDGLSYGTSVLADVHVQLSRRLELKLNYRWYDARTTYDGRLMARPFTPEHRGLIDLAYGDLKERWRADVSLNIFGTSRIPSTTANPEQYRMGTRAPSFATLHAQITHVVGNWEFYLGGENLTGALQSRQIIAAEDPFGPYFDASLIWGPTNLAMAYAGLRFTLPKQAISKPTVQ